MMTIENLVQKIEQLPGCTVYPAKGLPETDANHSLPTDLKEFYSLCGGVELFSDERQAVYIVPPEQVVPANPVIVGELCEEDISADWYIIAHDGNGDYLTIDLNSERQGRCYDSFWDRHGVVGECAIIASSFTDLLKRLIEQRGGDWYWLLADFTPIGDAYDDIEG